MTPYKILIVLTLVVFIILINTALILFTLDKTERETKEILRLVKELEK